jgi:hypothetical protein
VKDKTIDIGGYSIQCKALETYRGELFRHIDAISMRPRGELMAVEESLAKMELELKTLDNSDSGVGAIDVLGQFLADLGLAACSTPNVGCALAVVGKAIATFSMLSTATSHSSRQQRISELRTSLRVAREQLKSTSDDNLATGLRASIDEFNKLCANVRWSCL